MYLRFSLLGKFEGLRRRYLVTEVQWLCLNGIYMRKFLALAKIEAGNNTQIKKLHIKLYALNII